MASDTRDSIKLRTTQLILQPLPAGAAVRLPEDRAGAAAALGATLDAAWPLPDVLVLMPAQAERSPKQGVFGVWVMIELETNAVVGDIGFLAPPDEDGEVEMGYSVVPSRRRRGYASEAVAGLTAWALGQPGVTAILAGTDPDNLVSQRVLERSGFERTASTPAEVRWRLERGTARA